MESNDVTESIITHKRIKIIYSVFKFKLKFVFIIIIDCAE